jgi:hypothetical protein
MTDKTVSVYWFFVLFLIASVIVFVVYSLYGKPLDVREMEGLFLAEKIADCVSKGGQILPDVLNDQGEFSLTEDTLLNRCHLNFNTEEIYGWNSDQYFVSILFSPIRGKGSSSFVAYGNSNLKENANINFLDRSKKEKFPFCVDRLIYSKGVSEKEYYSFKITACVRKTEKNA